MTPNAGGMVHAVTALVRNLRAHGIEAPPAASVDAVRVLTHIDITDREEVRHALRTTLISRPEDLRLFDELFDTAWQLETSPGHLAPELQRLFTPDVAPPSRRARGVTLATWMKPSEDIPNEADLIEIRAPSLDERLGNRDFASYNASDAEAFGRIARRIARRLALSPSRRWKPSKRGRSLDLRRTLASAVRWGGNVVQFTRRERRVRPTRLVVVCDVSGSMELYARALLQFAHALQNAFARVETFTFATRLSHVTRELQGVRYREALGALTASLQDFGGGTRIGESLAALVRDHRALLTRKTICVILSDGWDVGSVDQLALAMSEIKRRVRRVIWLNPLMGDLGYKPEARGIQAVLDYVDLMLPAHNLAAFEYLARHLSV